MKIISSLEFDTYLNCQSFMRVKVPKNKSSINPFSGNYWRVTATYMMKTRRKTWDLWKSRSNPGKGWWTVDPWCQMCSRLRSASAEQGRFQKYVPPKYWRLLWLPWGSFCWESIGNWGKNYPQSQRKQSKWKSNAIMNFKENKSKKENIVLFTTLQCPAVNDIHVGRIMSIPNVS